ncbi:MAG: Ig-like domain-containing protein [Bacteroidetes bacterium]|nr:Ig-like domain-containing protein [Bacteroidota bacterium]
MKLNYTKLIVLLFCFIACIGLFSCANIIPPGGGPRDSLPPRLINSLPRDSAVNISTQNIVLTFDEYVQLQAVNENVIISPNPIKSPIIDSKLRNVTVKLKDSLEKNTTYSINFGSAIKDVNEGNLAKEFTYVFSTGNKIDTNHYNGYVILAESGKIDTTLIVVLHNNLNDSAIVKNKARYLAKLNGKGYFNFNFLPAGQFAAYVIPNDFTQKYDDSTKLFAYLNQPIVINKNTRTDTLYAYQEFKKKDVTSSMAPKSTGKAPPEDKRLKYTVNLDNGQQDLLSTLDLTFSRKLKSFDSSKIVLYDTLFKPITGYKFALDTGNTKLSIQYPWKEKTAFRIIINKDAVSDTAGINLPKADSARFITKRESDYGSCRFRFPNIDLSKNPVLQLIVEGKIVESIPITGKEFIRKRFKPAEYEIRVLLDANKNGVWDAGKFSTPKKQPEIVISFPKKAVIKADRDTDQSFSF